MDDANAGPAPEFWFNTATGQVEQGRQTSWEHLMGPYPTRAEAQAALERARERSRAWDEEDDAWHNS